MVHATLDMDNMDTSDPAQITAPCTMDKTFAEITGAISGGMLAVCECNLNGEKLYLPVAKSSDGEMYFTVNLGVMVLMVIYGDDDVAVFMQQSITA